MSELEEYLCQRYGQVKLGSDVQKRLQDAFSSHLQVKPEHLLNEWKTMEAYLNKERGKRSARGLDLTGSSLLKYDLSIVLDNYERYVRYITASEKQNLELNDIWEMREMTQNVLKYNKPEVKELRDVSDLVDEIYDAIGAQK